LGNPNRLSLVLTSRQQQPNPGQGVVNPMNVRFKSNVKRAQALLLAAVFAAGLVSLPISAQAAGVGVVDVAKVYSSYDSAQRIMAEIKVKEADLRKMQADYVKQLEESKSQNPNNPIGTQQMEKDLNDKLNAKLNEYRDWAETKQKELENTINNVIDLMAKTKGLDVILSKQAVFQGGTDITTDVITKLNQKPAGTATK
jgi:Skp family chaperone for outer membrane proteins